MRIIGGKNRGKKIIMPLDNKTRPLRDLVKESIFNLIEHSNNFNLEIKNSYILDLFSGTGSFGLECLSRGARSITFIENYKLIIKILKKNIQSINGEKNSTLIEEDCFDYFSKEKNFKNKFDIIFLDPPYKEKNLKDILLYLIDEKILKIGGIIILHRHKKQIDTLPNQIKILEEKRYGISKILFCNIA